MRLVSSMVILFIGLGIISAAYGHESQPGMLDLRQIAENRYEVIWRAPIYYGKPHPARLELPEHWQDVAEPTERGLPDSQLFRRIVAVGDEGVEGSILRFHRLESTITDVFVRLNRLDGSVMTAVARPSKP